MSNQNHNYEYKIYLPNTNEWVPVTEEVYREYYRPIWRIQKAARTVSGLPQIQTLAL